MLNIVDFCSNNMLSITTAHKVLAKLRMTIYFDSLQGLFVPFAYALDPVISVRILHLFTTISLEYI